MKYDLERFIKAQELNYRTALKEIRNGYKKTHWMWYIFPQLKDLGHSSMAIYYGIENLEEAKEYLKNDYLRHNLEEICNSLLLLNERNINYIMEYPDNLKLQSSMTLFSLADPENKIFEKVLKKFYDSEKDEETIYLIKE